MVYVELKKSSTQGKKYTMIFYNDERKKIKTTSFGQAGANDYTTHGSNREDRKIAYINRHKSKEKWDDYMSAGSLSRWILWNKPTITASYNDYIKKFGLKKY